MHPSASTPREREREILRIYVCEGGKGSFEEGTLSLYILCSCSNALDSMCLMARRVEVAQSWKMNRDRERDSRIYICLFEREAIVYVHARLRSPVPPLRPWLRDATFVIMNRTHVNNQTSKRRKSPFPQSLFLPSTHTHAFSLHCTTIHPTHTVSRPLPHLVDSPPTTGPG